MAAATDLDYCSLQRIREEAGLHHLSRFETLTGNANGSNTVFYGGRTYIVDRNYNDVIDTGSVNGDVIVYVNDVAVQVNAVDATTGAITLAVAPATSSVVMATYAHCVLSDVSLGQYRDEAIDFVHRKISGIIDFGAWQGGTTEPVVPPLVRTVVRIYAAGLILIQDQGLNTDTEDSSKDGYKRIATAKSLLDSYVEEAGGSAGASARVSVSSRSDGNIFHRYPDLSKAYGDCDEDECFFRNKC